MDRANLNRVKHRQPPLIDNAITGKEASDSPINSPSSRTSLTLLCWDDLPHWQRDNHHIHGSYRSQSGSFHKSFASLAYLHNESVNIYTHLIPSALSIPTGLYLHQSLRSRYEAATRADVVAFGCFFLGAALCMGMSGAYHTISNHSPSVNRVGNKLDYVGIVLLITGSFVPSVYYGFWCEPALRITYWTMV